MQRRTSSHPPGALRTVRLGALAIAVVSAGMLAVTTTPAAASTVSGACPWVGSSAPIPQRVSQLLSQMSVSQEVTLLTGVSGSPYVGFTPAISSLCIPAMNLEDGPAGPGDSLGGVTQLPAPVDVAATWDTSAEQQYGQVIGAEQAAKGTTVDLGPTLNIVRDPRWGRDFETVGEDPYLTGQMGAADIQGVQSTGVMAQAKHIAVYSEDYQRNTISAQVSTQAEQEIYLPAFQAAVQQGAVASMMCPTNYVNGVPACEDPYTLNTVLRQQFGFTGFVTSDWGSIYPPNATTDAADAGLNQDMPGNDGYYGSTLVNAVESGSVPKSTLDTLTSQVLAEMFAFGLFDEPPSGSVDEVATSAADQAEATQLAEEGTVLLRNSGGILPLGSADTSIAVIGADASTGALTSGTGSADVTSSGTVTPLQAITAAAPSGTSVTYNDGSDTSAAASTAAAAQVAVVFVSLGEGENDDLSSIDLPSAENSLISAVAAANPNTVVVLNTGSAVTMPWLSSVKGVLEAWYPGQQDGTAIANVLFGAYDPSGHLTVTFPTSLAQVPATTSAEWPGVDGEVDYNEGIDVGYRWYDSQGLTPLFPFGFGLSYTSFSFSNLHITPLAQGGAATVTATVTNTGQSAGADVAQLYVADPPASGQPPRQLEGFARVSLQPGQSQTVSFQVTQQNLQYWNTSTNTWATGTGDYGIEVGDADSATALPLSGTLSVSASQLGQPVTIANPGPQEGASGNPVSVQATAIDSTSGQTLSYSATGLPAGVSINPVGGAMTGTPTTAGTTTVTVTARDGAGAYSSTAFTWTVTSAGAAAPTTPLVGLDGLCLDVAGANNADGTATDIASCNGTDGQQWTEESDGTIHSLGKCLDVHYAGTSSGTLVWLYTCNGTVAQVWQQQPGGELVNPNSGMCLTDPGASTTLGTTLQIQPCTGAAAQSWIPGEHIGAISGYQAMCVDVLGANSADTTPIQVYNCNGTIAQDWTAGPDETIHALAKCMDVQYAGTASGTPVWLYTCNGTVAQVWQQQPGGELVNPNSGLCLTDPADGASGTQLEVTTCTGAADQQWSLP